MKKTIVSVLVIAILIVSANLSFGLEAGNRLVNYMDEKVVFDVGPMEIDGITMIPLRATLEKMGFTVEWNEEGKTVEMTKGAQWTSIKIGENSYFKNRMAPEPLSRAPIIVDGRTLVPAEFFSEILSKALVIEDGVLSFNEDEATIYSGFIKEIRENEKGDMSLTISPDLSEDDYTQDLIIHTSKDNTIFNHLIKEGVFIRVVTAKFMTLSLPGQTFGYLVY